MNLNSPSFKVGLDTSSQSDSLLSSFLTASAHIASRATICIVLRVVELTIILFLINFQPILVLSFVEWSKLYFFTWITNHACSRWSIGWRKHLILWVHIWASLVSHSIMKSILIFLQFISIGSILMRFLTWF